MKGQGLAEEMGWTNKGSRFGARIGAKLAAMIAPGRRKRWRLTGAGAVLLAAAAVGAALLAASHGGRAGLQESGDVGVRPSLFLIPMNLPR